MGRLEINQEKIINLDELIKICPFGTMENEEGKLEINSACKICVRKGLKGTVTYIEE